MPTNSVPGKKHSFKCLDCQLTTVPKVGGSYIISTISLTVGEIYLSYMYMSSPLSWWLNSKGLILTLPAIASIRWTAELSFSRKEYGVWNPAHIHIFKHLLFCICSYLIYYLLVYAFVFFYYIFLVRLNGHVYG